MNIYKHLSGSIIEVHEGSSQEDVYKNSPSWQLIEPFREETKPDSLLSKLNKEQLIEISKKKELEVSVHNTNKEIIEKIETKTKKYEVATGFKFNDNLL
jgi:hypothetical protein